MRRLASQVGSQMASKALRQAGAKNPPTAKLMPESSYVVRIHSEEIVCHRPDGSQEQVMWHDLQKVEIITTDDGPFAPDVFWLLHGTDNGCAIPQGATGDGELLEKLQALPGFDNGALINAMGSTSNTVSSSAGSSRNEIAPKLRPSLCHPTGQTASSLFSKLRPAKELFHCRQFRLLEKNFFKKVRKPMDHMPANSGES